MNEKLIKRILCELEKLYKVTPQATEWTDQHLNSSGNKYLKDTLVWYNGFIYKCLIDNSGSSINNPFFWEKVCPGWKLDQEQPDWLSTSGIHFIKNKPTKLSQFINDIGQGGISVEEDPVFEQWLIDYPLGETAFTNDYNDLDNLPVIPLPLTDHSELVLDDGTNPHGTTKSDVGLGNVNNTSDLDKPISNLTQAALNLKQNLKLHVPNTAYVTAPVNTIFATLYYPANTLPHVLILNSILLKINMAPNPFTIRYMHNTVNSLVGATQIAMYNAAQTVRFAKFERTYAIEGGNLVGYGFALNTLADALANASLTSSLAINEAVDNYFFLVVQSDGAVDTFKGLLFKQI